MKKIISIILAVAAIFSFSGCGENNISLSEYALGSHIPNMEFKKMELQYDFGDSLAIEIPNTDSKMFNDYIAFSIEQGYSIDVKKDETSYSAYSNNGYFINVDYWSDSKQMNIKVEKPMNFKTITWPSNTMGKIVPATDSLLGVVEWENDSGFVLYISDTDVNAYNEYVETCKKAGFTINFSKGDDFYYADDKHGNGITLRYEGNNIVFIRADNNKELENPEIDKDDNPGSQDKVDFKEALDSYEKFINKYVEFMKKYNSTEDASTLLSDYTKYLNQYAETMDKISKIDTSSMSTEDLAYYVEVTNRINTKLLEAIE